MDFLWFFFQVWGDEFFMIFQKHYAKNGSKNLGDLKKPMDFFYGFMKFMN